MDIKKICGVCRKGEFMEGAGALSRYVDYEICGQCGTREAFEGFFWHSMAIHFGLLDGEIMSTPISKL